MISKLKTFITASSLIAFITPTLLMGETTAKSIGQSIDNSVITPMRNWINKPGSVKIPTRDLKIVGIAAGGAVAIGATAAGIRAVARATGGKAAPIDNVPEEDEGGDPILPTQAIIDNYLAHQAQEQEAIIAGEVARAKRLAEIDAEFEAKYPALQFAEQQFNAGENEALRQLSEGKTPAELVAPEGADSNFSRGFRYGRNRAIFQNTYKPSATSAPKTTSPTETARENTLDDEVNEDSGFAPEAFGGETDDDLSQAINRAEAGEAADTAGVESASTSGSNATVDAVNAGSEATDSATQAVESATNQASGPYEDEGADVGDIAGTGGDTAEVVSQLVDDGALDAIE